MPLAEYRLSVKPMILWISKDTPESRDAGKIRKHSQQHGYSLVLRDQAFELIYRCEWFFWLQKKWWIGGLPLNYIIHCSSCLKCIQASGKSEGFWSDPTSNNAFEAPTDDGCDGQWQFPEQVPGWDISEEKKKPTPENTFNLWTCKPAMATLHISSNNFDHRN